MKEYEKTIIEELKLKESESKKKLEQLENMSLAEKINLINVLLKREPQIEICCLDPGEVGLIIKY